MFALTGVTKPELDTAELNGRKGSYDSLQKAAGNAESATNSAAQNVLAMNKGDAANAFDAKVLGEGGLHQHLVDVRDAAGRTATAYGDAATKGGSAKTAMIAYAKSQQRRWWLYAMAGMTDEAVKIVNESRTELQRLETMGGNDVTVAFGSLDLPVALPLNYDQGKVDPRVRSDWETSERDGGMSVQQRKDFLQSMADKYARDHGFPPITITWESPGKDLLGQYRHGENKLFVDPANLQNADVMGTVIHEMQHRAQYTGKDAWRWPWDDVKNGMSREEADRWNRLNDTKVRDKGYWERPVEVDARQSQADYLNQLSYDEYMQMRDPHYQAPARSGTATMDFHPPVWKTEGDKLVTETGTFYRAAEPVVTMLALPTPSNSPIDKAAAAGDVLCLLPWHALVAGVREHLSGLGSHMIATGTDYAATEEDNTAAADRFWK